MISTRDCFTSDIYGEKTSCDSDSGCTFEKTRWFIKSTDAPPHYDTAMEKLFSGQSCMEQTILDGMVSNIVRMEGDPDYQGKSHEYLLPLGVTTYNGVYTLEELDRIEEQCDNLHQDGSKGILPKECYHSSLSKKGVLKRTKYFFGSRYLWSREQLKSPLAKIAGGIRRDVPKPPQWMKVCIYIYTNSTLYVTNILPNFAAGHCGGAYGISINCPCKFCECRGFEHVP